MKSIVHYIFVIAILGTTNACRPRYYTASNFEEKTATHRVAAVIPAEIILTGKQPKDLSEEQIAEIEEEESMSFQLALYHSILRHANSGRYETTINFQDAIQTQSLLKQNNIDARTSWRMTDEELTKILGVDAIVRMRITKQRYLSDKASYGIAVAKQIVHNTGIGSKLPLPPVRNKTNDIYASCNLVQNGQALWNDHYKAASDYNSPANEIIEGITDTFGRHFPYKKKR